MRVEGEGVGPATDDNRFDLLEGCNYLQGRSSEKSPLNKLIINQLMENLSQRCHLPIMNFQENGQLCYF